MVRFPSLLLLLLLFLSATTVASSPHSISVHDRLPLSWIPGASSCRGNLAECLAGEEFDLSSERAASSIRRVLAASGYISYSSLRSDSVPCSHRGASYYNCRPGAYANVYSRGCSSITQCRGS